MDSEDLPPITVHYSGLFDFDGFYAAVIDWAKNYGYIWHERSYKHKVPSPEGAKQEFLWTIEKNVTEYINYTINFEVNVWDMTEVEVEVNGKKKTLTKGRIHINMDGTVSQDWQKRFEGSKFAEWLGKIYSKLSQKKIESVYIDALYYRMWNLQALIKKYFDMQTKKYAYKGYLGED